MTKKKAVEDSIKHWERMIKWAEGQPKNNYCSRSKMHEVFGEDWSDGNCALCGKFYIHYSCEKCPQAKKHGACGRIGGAWKTVTYSKTWEKWIKNAGVMLKQLRSLRG